MLKHTFAGFIFLLVTLAGCQSSDEQSAAQETVAAQTETEEKQPRPKPDFFMIPQDLAKKRVYICMDNSADTFHQKHDCEVLIACKSTFRNLTLTRAVEAFDRYNCETCSSDLAHIYDENAVRMETGLQ